MQAGKLIFIFATCLLGQFACSSLRGQTLYRQTQNSYIAVSGTSTLHDWTMTSKEPKCQVYLEQQSSGEPTVISSFSLSVKSESLKSGHSAMDKNAYSTLNTSQHKNIVFELTNARLNAGKAEGAGQLTVAGLTKPITLEVNYKALPNGTVLLWGSKKLQMSDFGIEPPTFMFGTVQTGDPITVSFNFELTAAKK